LQIGTAFSTAAQNNLKSQSASAALAVLCALLHTAEASGLMKNGTAAGSIGSSMRQQLQDSGFLQQLAGLMLETAVELRREAAAFAGLSSEELCSFSTSLLKDPAHIATTALGTLHGHLRDLWGSAGESDAANSIAWLCDPSHHAEGAMHLSLAGLQHVGSMLRHVLPAVQQRAPQQAAELVQAQQERIEGMINLGRSLLKSFGHTGAVAQEEQLQQLLVSPVAFPWAASLLVLNASWASQACNRLAIERRGPQGSSSGSSGRNRGSSARDSSSTVDDGGTAWQGTQGRDSSCSRNSSSSGRGGRDDTRSTCQLHMLEVLGLAPLLDRVGPPCLQQLVLDLHSTMAVLAAYNETALGLAMRGEWHSVQSAQQAEQYQQHWQYEQRLWLLLPAVLLPCINSLMLACRRSVAARGTDALQVSEGWHIGMQTCAQALLEQSSKALSVPMLLHSYSETGSWCLADLVVTQPLHPAWMGEVLGGVLQIADQLLLQQQQTELHTQAAAAAAGTQGCTSMQTVPDSSSSSSGGSRTNSSHALQQSRVAAACASTLAQLLSLLVYKSSLCSHSGSRSAVVPPGPSSSSSSSSSSGVTVAGDTAAAAAPEPPSLPPVAERFVEVCAALEFTMRVATAAAQRDADFGSTAMVSSCLLYLFPASDREGANFVGSPLVLHMGLRGPEALAHEQRRLYSLLSTIQKLSRCQAGAAQELCWGQPAANACCWEVARAAVGLLQGVPPGVLPAAPTGVLPAAAGAGAAAEAEAVAAASGAVPAAVGHQDMSAAGAVLQQPAADLLPSLVLLGRCFLAWAEQLQQLLAIKPGGQVPGEVYLPQNAACLCIPGWKQLLEPSEDESTPVSCELLRLVPVVTAWVDGITCPAARAALAAAAGGELQQLRQQLKAVSAAQRQAPLEALCNAALAKIAQQLHRTGVMLCSIAVPHFCNNAACVNVSGATDVQLVSGRSCLCAGCRTARYCGRVCQRQAWQQHKPVCKALKAAAAGNTQL
jgi:hypothetical protein